MFMKAKARAVFSVRAFFLIYSSTYKINCVFLRNFYRTKPTMNPAYILEINHDKGNDYYERKPRSICRI